MDCQNVIGILADALRELAVTVVLYRATAIPLALVHAVRQIHHHSEARQIRSLGIGGVLGHGLRDFHRAVAADFIGNRELGLDLRCLSEETL